MILVKEKDGNLDELFEKAIKVCAPYDLVSASLIQRRLSIGYAHAARILDQMEFAGIAGPGKHGDARELLILKGRKHHQTGATGEPKDWLLANSQLITEVLATHDIAVRLAWVKVQPRHIVFMFDFDVRARIDDILALDKEIATALASPTGKVEMGAPFKGTPFLFIYLPITKGMKQASYRALNIDVRTIAPSLKFLYRRKLRETLYSLSAFFDRLAYKV